MSQHKEPLYDSQLLTRARTQWQFGDWQSLAQLAQDQHHLALHPQRAELRILATAGVLQTQAQPDAAAAKAQLKQSLEEGASREAVARILIAGVYNSLGRVDALLQRSQQASNNFRTAVEIGMPGDAIDLVVRARILHQLEKLPFMSGKKKQLKSMRLPSDLERTPGFLELDQIYQDRLSAAFQALEKKGIRVKLPSRLYLTDYLYCVFEKIKCIMSFEIEIKELRVLFYSSNNFILPIHIFDSPHYRYADDYLSGRDCGQSRAHYQEYRHRQFPKENTEEKSYEFEILMRKIQCIYKSNGNVNSVKLLTNLPKEKGAVQVYDGFHRLAILAAIGVDVVSCAMDIEDRLNPNGKRFS